MTIVVTPESITLGDRVRPVPHPRRVRRTRVRGRPGIPPGAVYLGRPTVLGNPFVHPEPGHAVEAYARLLLEPSPSFVIEPGGLQFARRFKRDILEWWFPGQCLPGLLEQLRGLPVCCWCPLDRPCHCDVIAYLVDSLPEAP
ncbi:DUF4326 domain-containing protein [Tautonia sp. JC769]|uniref:DUF4326 domain-containing protein n=1 Tax=Tautonia sp. JC769 TaxID=3232135 RepID=UPI003458AAC1